MSDETNSEGAGANREPTVWLLVDHSAREAALVPIATELEKRGVEVELVTITEVIGSVAREALAGGAERLLRGLRVATRGGEKGDEDLVGAIRRRQPEVLVVTKARHARAIGVLENLTGVKSLQVGLVEDFFIDPAWLSGQLHAFVVPDEETGQALVDRGVDEERIKVGGPALRPGFEAEIDRSTARDDLGLNEERLVVLVRADGFDASTLEKLVFQCTLCDRDARFVFHYDGDGATASTLRRAADQYGLPAAMFGRVSDLERYFGAADAVVAREDDAYLAELLQSGTPCLLAAQSEERSGNAEALAERDLVDSIADIGQLGTVLDRFLQEEHLEERSEVLEQWRGVERHKALVDVLETVVDHAEQWRKPASAAQAPKENGEAKDEEPVEPAGPFETIGRKEGGEERGEPSEKGEEARRPRADYSTLTRAEAKEQLAQLIMKEREAERRLKELEKQQERWRDRLQLAREWNEDDLAEEAESILRGYIEEADPLEQELTDIRRQKEKLKSAARGEQPGDGSERGEDGAPGDRVGRMEDRFRKMEVDRDLEGLKDRIRRELGE